MFWSYMLNIPLAFAMLLVFLFAVTDVAAATTEAFPFVWVLQNSLSKAGATAITALMFVLVFMIETSCYASTSRQTFAFARDDGLPFSSWMKKVFSLSLATCHWIGNVGERPADDQWCRSIPNGMSRRTRVIRLGAIPSSCRSSTLGVRMRLMRCKSKVLDLCRALVMHHNPSYTQS